MANSAIARYQDWKFTNFWPRIAYCCGNDSARLFLWSTSFCYSYHRTYFCVELALGLLPFTLGICPLHSLERISIVSVILGCAAIVCFVYFLATKRSGALIVMVLFGLGLVWMLGEVGIFERLLAASSYSRHNSISHIPCSEVSTF